MDLHKVCKTIDNIYESMYVYKALLVYDENNNEDIYQIVDMLREKDYPVTLDNTDINARLYCIQFDEFNMKNILFDTLNTVNLIMCFNSFVFHNIVDTFKFNKQQFQDRLFVIKI